MLFLKEIVTFIATTDQVSSQIKDLLFCHPTVGVDPEEAINQIFPLRRNILPRGRVKRVLPLFDLLEEAISKWLEN